MSESNPKTDSRVFWGIFMTIAYIGIAYMLVFTTLFENIDHSVRVFLAVILFLYGIFRGYRTIRSLKK